MPLVIGSVLNDRYQIVSLLGEGGMGAVYRGFDQRLNRHVAVKENFTTTQASARQFEREASILASLRHANLPVVFDHFLIPDQGQYLVMEFVEGEDLQHMVKRRGPLPEAEAIIWIDQVAAALEYLHRQNPPIIHRDVKPGNIKITPEGNALLVDFGIAKQFSDQQRTMTGAQAVSPGFSPPEQYGEAATDARSDVFALAATVSALLTGAPPTNSLDRLLGKGALVAPAALNPNISKHVSAAVLKGLELKPADRYATMADFRFALKRPPADATEVLVAEAPRTATHVAALPTVQRPEWSLPPSLPVPQRRSGWLWVAVIGVPIAIVIAAGAVLAAIGFMPLLFLAPTATATAAPKLAPTLAPAFTATLPPPTGIPTPVPTVLVVGSATPTAPADTPTPAPATNTPAPAIAPAATAFGGGDGKIAFWSHESGLDRIFLMNADGTGLGEVGRGLWPAWAPDGRILAYIVSQLKPSPDESLYIRDPRKQQPDYLARVPVDDNHLDWSRDGQFILFTDYSKGGGEARALVKINPFTKEKTTLLDDGAINLDAVFSPDGSQIAFSSNKSGDFEIYVMKADGSEAPQQIVYSSSFEDRYPSWSPDGLKIAFSSNRESKVDQIYIMRSDGNDVVRVTRSKVAERQPAWSPDGQHIAFASFRDGNLQIYVMDPDGQNQKRLTTRYKFPNQNPAWKPSVQ